MLILLDDYNYLVPYKSLVASQRKFFADKVNTYEKSISFILFEMKKANQPSAKDFIKRTNSKALEQLLYNNKTEKNLIRF